MSAAITISHSPTVSSVVPCAPGRMNSATPAANRSVETPRYRATTRRWRWWLGSVSADRNVHNETAGGASSTVSHRPASPIAIALLVGGHSGLHHGPAEPRVETSEQVGRAMEWLDHGTIEERVEEPALERDQVQPAARAPRSSDLGG